MNSSSKEFEWKIVVDADIINNVRKSAPSTPKVATIIFTHLGITCFSFVVESVLELGAATYDNAFTEYIGAGPGAIERSSIFVF